MAHFYANIMGESKTAVSRCGTKSSGIWGHVRGWNIGAVVDIVHENGKDVLGIAVTGGTHNASRSKLILTMTEGEPIPVLKEAVEFQECPHCGAVLDPEQ